MDQSRVVLCAAALAFAGLLAPPLLAQGSGTVEKGDLWKVSTTMSMNGMDLPMGPQSHDVCSDRAWTRPPIGSGDKDCQVSNVVNTPSKTTWDMVCSGEHAMKGTGEMHRTGPDDYTGTMNMTGDDGSFVMKMKGHKVGECDVAAVRKERADTIARVQAQSDAAVKMQADVVKQTCEGSANALDLMTLTMPGGICSDPAYKAAFCAKMKTREGYGILAAPGRPPQYGLAEAGKYCGVDPGSLLAGFCSEAMTQRDLSFIGANCPDQTKEIAAKECGGIDTTSEMNSEIGRFCGAYARDAMAKDAGNQEAKPETKKDKTKKILKGIFP
jgi:hypothetical protein